MPRQPIVLSEECVSCGACAAACPRKAIAVRKGLYAEVNPLLCVGCGICEKTCPAGVISMKQPEAKP
jgi:Pyruvate/2-oxoacid:ferredoxin oxidoreductase delta subunit